jgi:hypothetical protein
MGLIDPLLLDDWDRKQHSDYQNSERHTVVQLPCCGTSIEVDPKDGTDQYVTCPNIRCPKRTARGGARHLIAFALRKTTIQSERPMPEL